MIDFAKKEDILQISSAIDRSDYSGFETQGLKVDKESLLLNILRSIARRESIVIVGKIDGQVEGIVVIHMRESFYEVGSFIGTVAMWNVTEEYKNGILGLKMLKYAIKIARMKGCNMIDASYVPGHSPESLQKVYEKLGMKPVETLYRMEIYDA
jgi:hypothetical protein